MPQSSRPHIAISGASSFTALWIIHELASHARVTALVPQKISEYTGLKKLRLSIIAQYAEIQDGISAENDQMANWIEASKPDVWIHHHHHMADFRSPQYDRQKADQVGLLPLPSLVQAIKRAQTKGVLFSGSYFEPGEGGQAAAETPRTSYSQSKLAVWNQLHTLANDRQVRLSKIVISNPVGPLENQDRLIPNLIRAAKQKIPFKLMAPATRADNIPILALAQVYRQAAFELLNSNTNTQTRIYRPSGEHQSNLELVQSACHHLIRGRLELLPPEIDRSVIREGITFENPLQERVPNLNWDATWDHYAQVLKESGHLSQI